MDSAVLARQACYLLPYPRNPLFFGRQKELEYVRKALSCSSLQDSGQSKGLVLWGLAGVGKTQVAREYVYQQIETQTHDAVFWVPSKTNVEIAQGFTNIALKFSLTGASPQDHDMNRYLVMSWLRQSSEFLLR